MTKPFKVAILILTCFILAFGALGCQNLTGSYTLAKQSAIDAQVAAARAETQSQMKALTTQQIDLLNQKVIQLTAQQQDAADYLFLGSATFGTLKTPTRPEMVMGHSIEETAAQLPPASAAKQASTFKQMQVDLDEAKTTNAQLQARYDTDLNAAKVEATTKQATITDLNTKLNDTETAKQKVLADGLKKQTDLDDARKAIDAKDLAAKQKALDDANSTKAIKTKMSMILGGLALICLAGAIWSPVFKEHFGLGAAILSLASIGLWYIQGWMIAIAVGVGILALVCWAVKNHNIESKTLTNVVCAIQNVKDTAKADYDKVVAPALVAYQTTYNKAGVAVPDPATIAHVDQKLIAAGVK